jgi:hypothetical protein
MLTVRIGEVFARSSFTCNEQNVVRSRPRGQAQVEREQAVERLAKGMIGPALAIERPTRDLDERREQKAAPPPRFDAPAIAEKIHKLGPSKMMVPDHSVRPCLIAGVALASPDEPAIEGREAEPKVVRVEESEEARVWGPQDESTASLENATDLRQRLSALLGWNVFENFDARDAVEPGVVERELLRARVMQFGVGEFLARLLDCREVNLHARELDRRRNVAAMTQKGPDMASDVQQRLSVFGHPSNRVHQVPLTERSSAPSGLRHGRTQR